LLADYQPTNYFVNKKLKNIVIKSLINIRIKLSINLQSILCRWESLSFREGRMSKKVRKLYAGLLCKKNPAREDNFPAGRKNSII